MRATCLKEEGPNEKTNVEHFMFIGLGIIVIFKKKRTTLCFFLFYFTSYVINMFRKLIYPLSGACDYSVELPRLSYCSVKTEDVALA